MLVQFRAKNVLSFKEEVILDMRAIHAYKEHEGNLIDIGVKDKFLRVAAIYGANASGKSNLYFAMSFFQRIIMESLNHVDDGKETVLQKAYRPFKFEERKENSEFEVVEILGEYEYRYGFLYNADYIVEEWLYRKSLKTNRTITVFERITNKIEFGTIVRRECEIYKEQIPPETLALSFFHKLKLDTEIFGVVFLGIMDTLVTPTDFYENTDIIESFLPMVIDNEKEKLLDFLTAIDTGIKDITYDDNEKKIRFHTYHKGRNGKDYKLDLYEESEGTIKSIILFMYIRGVILSKRSIFVDELNTKLHPLLLKFIIDLFYNDSSKAQLIYTTHDTTLMDKKFFRRDQIYFVEKDEFGYSTLSALSDYKVRSDASFEKDYLAGVYGGIPFLKEFEMKEGE